MTETFEIVQEPGTTGTQEDLEAQRDLWLAINGKLDETAKAINRSRDLRAQLAGWAERVGHEELAQQASDLRKMVLAIEEKLHVPDLRPGWADGINAGTRLFEQLAGLPSAVNLGDYKPTDQAQEVFADLAGQIDAVLAEMESFIRKDIANFNDSMEGVTAVVPQ